MLLFALVVVLNSPCDGFLYQPGSPQGNTSAGQIWDPSITWWRNKFYMHAMYQYPSDTTNVLLRLYEATLGEGWLDNTNWLQGEPCVDSWYGVLCCPLTFPYLGSGEDGDTRCRPADARGAAQTGTDLPKRKDVSVKWDVDDTSGSNTLSDEAHLNKT